jgi:2,3-bisphosphoglycerate-independent phosphoglycerate mutase
MNAPAWVGSLGSGRLADVAPTVLALMGLAQPAAMTGRALVTARALASATAGNRASA